MAYRRSVLQEVGGLDERFPRAYREDADLGLRVVRAGYRKFVFDLSHLEHIGSMGLRLLVGLAHQVKGDGSVVLCDLTTVPVIPPPRRTLWYSTTATRTP